MKQMSFAGTGFEQWFGLSDPAMEKTLHDVPLYREFAGLDAGATRMPDESTILRFRHLLEEHHLSLQLLATINATLATMVRYRGLAKNTAQLITRFALGNLWMARHPIFHA